MRRPTRSFFRDEHSWAGTASAALLAASACGCGDLDPAVGGLEPPAPAATGTATSGVVDFGRDIRPLMSRVPVPPPASQGCARCHYSTITPHPGIDIGGLDLTTLGTLRLGGTTSGANIVIAGDPEGSSLVQKLQGTYYFGDRMPKNGPPFWTDAEIGLVIDWIAQGAKGADDE
jgi:hypothetical protein